MQLLIKALTQFGQAMGRSITLGLMAVVALTMLAGMSQLTAQGSETGASAADAIVEAVRKAGALLSSSNPMARLRLIQMRLPNPRRSGSCNLTYWPRGRVLEPLWPKRRCSGPARFRL
jgi:hypothetical protein